MTQKSHRIMFRFWLDIVKPDELKIADTIEILKNERSFTQTIRDGIRLIFDLKQGKLDVLFELFPWVRAEFMDYMRDIQPVVVTQTSEVPAVSAGQYQQAWIEAEEERLEAERKWHEKRVQDAEKALEAERKQIELERTKTQKVMQAQLDRLEQLLLQQGNQPISAVLQPLVSGGGGSPQALTGPKSLTVPKFTTPTYDDDDDDFTLNVQKDENSGAQAALNFLDSIKQLHQ
ncbi:MAG: hypothetical protein Crog4KO_34630 [Crocinitomicaceae bacterium]